MLVEDVYAIYRRFTDETDYSFEDPASEAVTNLRFAYESFRRLIHQINPWALVNTVNLVFAASDIYGLAGAMAVVILGDGVGAAYTNPKLVEVVALQEVDATTNQVILDWRPVSNIDELRVTNRGFVLIADQLLLSEVYTGTLALRYLGSGLLVLGGGTDWTQIAPGSAQPIQDDFDNYHDLIAMLAYDYYAIADGDINPKLEEMKHRRIQELQSAVYRRMARSGHVVNHAHGKGSGGWY